MTVVKAIGKNTLGQGDKMNVAMKSYEMSTHDLSRKRRTTMAPGLLTPVLQTIGLPGDKFDIEIQASVLTLPTNGPLFGSFNFEVHLFKADLRLYQSMLQNNELDMGMAMETVKLPQLILGAENTTLIEQLTANEQVNPSSILSRLGIKGVGHSTNPLPAIITREFNATSWLAYWDIFKNFFANKQEKNAYVVHNEIPINYEADIAAIVYRKNYWPNVTIPVAPGTVLTQVLSNQGDNLLIMLPLGYNLDAVYPEYIRLNLVSGSGSIQASVTEVFNEQRKWTDGVNDGWEMIGVNPIYWGYTITNYIVTSYYDIPKLPPRLKEFPLSNLDDMRRQILNSAVGITITDGSIEPYGLALEKYTDPVYNKTKTSIQGTQEGLATITYKSDIFNNWIRSEYVENTNANTAVSTLAGNFTMDALNFAKKLYDLQNRISLSGGTIDDWIETVWTAGRPNNVITPEYMGGMSREVEFEEVIATAETVQPNTNVPLGQLGGRGVTRRQSKGGNIKIVVGTAPCVILGLAVVTPRIGYSQGNAWETGLKNMNDLHKPAMDGIGYQQLITDKMDWRDTEIPNSGTTPITPAFRSIGYQPAWLDYTTAFDEIDGNFAILENQGFMVLDRGYEFTKITPEGTKDKTTYIDPTHYNYAFRETSLDAQNFWVQIGFDIKARRKMSARQIPNM